MSSNFANSWQKNKHIYAAHHTSFIMFILYLVKASNDFYVLVVGLYRQEDRSVNAPEKNMGRQA